jgi:hypothetical protein
MNASKMPFQIFEKDYFKAVKTRVLLNVACSITFGLCEQMKRPTNNSSGKSISGTSTDQKGCPSLATETKCKHCGHKVITFFNQKIS